MCYQKQGCLGLCALFCAYLVQNSPPPLYLSDLLGGLLIMSLNSVLLQFFWVLKKKQKTFEDIFPVSSLLLGPSQYSFNFVTFFLLLFCQLLQWCAVSAQCYMAESTFLCNWCYWLALRWDVHQMPFLFLNISRHTPISLSFPLWRHAVKVFA